MGRAKGASPAATTLTRRGASSRATGRFAAFPRTGMPARSAVPLAEAQQALVSALRVNPATRALQGLRLALSRCSESAEKLLNGLLNTGMPEEWALDTVLSEMAPTVRHRDGERALGEYLAARLNEDRSLLTQAGVLSAAAAAQLNGTHIDSERAWAALRAADLLRARQEVLDSVAIGEEGERARTHLAALCASEASAQFTEDGGDSKQTVKLLALTRGLTNPELEDARLLLYGEGELARTRAMMAAAGLSTDGPAVFVDFSEFEAVFEYPRFAERIAGFCNSGTNIVALNRGVALELMLKARDAGTYSKTLVHELVHTRQTHDWGDDEKRTMSEEALYMALMEGSTDNEARFLLPEIVEEESVYLDERMFVHALADLCCEGQPGEARSFIRELATASNTQLQGLAAQRLLGSSAADAQKRLAAAHWRFFLSAQEVYTDGGVKALARACLVDLRDGPVRDGDELYAWSREPVVLTASQS